MPYGLFFERCPGNPVVKLLAQGSTTGSPASLKVRSKATTPLFVRSGHQVDGRILYSHTGLPPRSPRWRCSPGRKRSDRLDGRLSWLPSPQLVGLTSSRFNGGLDGVVKGPQGDNATTCERTKSPTSPFVRSLDGVASLPCGCHLADRAEPPPDRLPAPFVRSLDRRRSPDHAASTPCGLVFRASRQPPGRCVAAPWPRLPRRSRRRYSGGCFAGRRRPW